MAKLYEVELPDGTIVEDVPEGTPMDEVAAFAGQTSQPAQPAQTTGPSIRDAVTDPEFWSRDIPRNLVEQLPTMGAMALPFAGPGGLLGSAALAGAGGAAGEAFKQFIGKAFDGGGFDPGLDVAATAKEGAQAAGGTLLFGGIFKALFGRGTIDDVADKAIKYASEKGAPVPAATSMQGRAALKTGRVTAAGDAEYARQAGKISQVIDDEIAALGTQSSADDVVEAARKTLLTEFDPRRGYKGIHDIIPKELPIVMNRTLSGMREAADRLSKSGDELLKNRITQIVERNSDDTVWTFDQLDGLMTDLQKLRTPSNNKILEDVIASMKDDIGLAVQADDAIFAATEAAGGVQQMFSKAGKSSFKIRQALEKAPQIRGMMKEGVTPGSFLAKFSTSQTIRAAIKDVAPDLHDELSRAWLARNLDRFVGGDKINGIGFARFLQENQRSVKEMFGEQAESIENFSAYLRYVQETVKEGGRAREMLTSPLGLFGRGGTEVAVLGVPGALAAEGSGWALINRLMTPGTTLFRLFTEGVPDAGAALAGVPAAAGLGNVAELFSSPAPP